MNKFEKLIEYIINDEDQKARELFHDIVVEKSRDIYESIMDEEQMEENVAGNQVEDMVDEVGHEEAMGEDDEEGEEFELGGDHDSEEDGEEPAFGGEEEPAGEEGHDEVVMNIDAKLDELLAKFDEIMGGEEHGEEPMDMDHEEPAMGDEHGEEAFAEQGMMEGEQPEWLKKGSGKSGSAQSGKSGSAASGKSGKSGSGKTEGKKSTSEIMREYVDKIGEVYGGQGDANEGDAVGAAGKKVAVNTKPGSVGPGADFGGHTATPKGGEQNQDGTSPTKASNEYTKGEGKLIGNVGNTPGGDKKLKSTGDEYSKEHPADGKLAGDDGSVPQNTKSVQKQNTGKK
jgi:hypothetical protein